MELDLKRYSDKSFVIRGGGTRLYATLLKQIGGKFNARLQGGPGWIFSNDKFQEVNKYMQAIQNGTLSPTDQVTQEQLDNKSITYKIYQPITGQKAIVDVSGTKVEFQVINTAVSNTHDVIDNVYIQPIIKLGTEEDKALLQITNGQWQIRGYINDHTVNFVSTSQGVQISTTSSVGQGFIPNTMPGQAPVVTQQ